MQSSSIEPSEVLREHKVIAVVGASKNPEKDANTVPAYLTRHGYTIIPVNPTADMINGLKAYPSLAELPLEIAKAVEVVDVFRPSEELPEVARQVVILKRRTSMPVVFWAQLGLENDEAKEILKAGGVDYVMDACMRTEHAMMGRSLMSFQGKMNEEWHRAHKMPDNPTKEQRAKWHFEHASACGCRPVPESVGDEVRGMFRAAGSSIWHN